MIRDIKNALRTQIYFDFFFLFFLPFFCFFLNMIAADWDKAGQSRTPPIYQVEWELKGPHFHCKKKCTPRARRQHLSAFCIIAPRKAIFLDGMTQASVNTVISAQATAGSGEKKDRGGGGGEEEATGQLNAPWCY